MKKNSWGFAIKGSVIAIALFLVAFVTSKMTMPKVVLGTEGISNIFVIYLAGFVAALIIIVSTAISFTRVVIPAKYLQPKKEVSPKYKTVNRFLIGGLLGLIILEVVSLYLITRDTNAPKQEPVSINNSFNNLPKIDQSYTVGSFK